MVTVSYPGVYVQEVPSGVRTIAGVSTSITAFIGFFRKGPMNEAVEVLSFADFEREFGGLDAGSETTYAVSQFFLNGGTRAYIVRVAAEDSAAAASVTANDPGGAASLTITAANEGEWGNLIRVGVDYDSDDPDSTFNLTVTSYDENDAGTRQQIAQEVWRNLSMDESATRFVETVVNDDQSGSSLVRVTALPGQPAATTTRPAQTGTASGDVSGFAGFTNTGSGTTRAIAVTIGGTAKTLSLDDGGTTVEEARAALEEAIRAADASNPAFAQATVTRIGDSLRIVAGATDDDGDSTDEQLVTFAASGTDPTFTDLALDTAVTNVQQLSLGTTTTTGFQVAVASGTGDDGDEPDGSDIIGSQANKTGIYALEDVDLFNLLCIPRAAQVSSDDDDPLSATDAAAVLTAAIAYCVKRRAFFIMDTPDDITEPTDIREWLTDNATLRSRNAALYYPRVQIPDPENENRLRSVGASGTVAGLYARIDSARGVWKAPGGTEATLTNVQRLDYTLTDDQNGVLNPLAINCFRNFRDVGNVCWGARTLDGADTRASEWKYVPVRRLALYMEESLFRGLQWVVFEPNDEPLWAQIRLNVGNFMQGLFRKGAFEGKTPKEAYFVKCDGETTTATDRDLGIVNIWVGFAPLKPAEFVVLYLQQKTAESQG